MIKNTTLFLLFISTFSIAQKIQILDSETSEPIANARIISEGNIYYTNEEGYSLLKENSKNLEISASKYETLHQTDFKATLKLKPYYKNIDEVKIVFVDFQKILKNVLNRYPEVYYSNSGIYDVNIKQKSFENNELRTLIIADGQFWSRDGQYNAKDAYNDKFDNFVQLQIDNLRYLKNQPYEVKIQEKKEKTSKDNVGDMFLNYELWRTYRLSKIKNAKVSGRLIFENGDEQEISYSIKADSTYIYTGKFIYNKKDQAITHFVLDFIQNKSQPTEYKDINGQVFYRQLGDGSISFDYYKNGDKYVPSKISIKSNGFKLITNNQTSENSSERNIIFKNFKETDKKGLEKPVKINQNYWYNMSISDQKEPILLTKEELEFVNKN